MRKINTNTIGAGFILGCVIQLNWANDFLASNGLFCFIGKYGSRLLISAFLFALVFFLIDQFIGEKFRSTSTKILSSFYFCALYLFFPPSNQLLISVIVLSLLILPIYNTFVKPRLANNNNQVFKNIVYAYLSIFLLAFSKELLIIVNDQYHSFTYLHYTTLLIAPLVFLVVPIICNRCTKIYTIIIFIIYLVFTIISNAHIITYSADMPHSSYYAIWETNHTEALDYLNQYITIPIIGIHLLLFVLGLFIIMKIKPISRKMILSTRQKLSLTVFVLLFSFYSNSYSANIPVIFIENLVQYKAELNKFKDKIEFRKNNPLHEQPAIVSDQNIDEQTIVLVIGESASKQHQGLYNYCRNTNPLLSSIQNELFIYNNVIAPHSHTNPVLSKLLTFANYDNMDPLFNQRSIIEYFSDAGYKTFWLSNQQFANRYSTMSSSIGIQSDWYIFTQQDGEDNENSQSSYDEALFKPFQIALDDNAPKKLIVLHLMGSHSDKTKRYPPKYAKFKTNECLPNEPYISNWVKDLINAHDNSVLYNDYVLYEFISQLRATNSMAYLIYASDHGEEVFDYRDFWGHSEANASIYMLEIPFILWLSEPYKAYYTEKSKNLNQYIDRKYQTDDLIHSIIDLSGCRSTEFDSTRSIFSPYFKPRHRWIDKIDFDEMIESGKKSVTD